ncbi:pyrroline-5-carboxylate reductase [Bacteroides sp. OttesenSCG-928-E20]|nr:pyrroline-5-carboxylate reductase [Bacteroides sp. OttesenSCG-928-N06]MDL2299099.1 pyrroline-5-carboxylate reductase [Bacteroides sp. OttesenSCG-928-E20]MDL2304130.1 pyrroline-5-carboxylate reductase [Bacteroides sp. OttesenSCG-928-D19]
MKISIIGAGNMGGAIAKGLTRGSIVKAEDITVSDLSEAALNDLKLFNGNINITRDNQEAIDGADVIVLAVKPWLAKEVIGRLQIDYQRQMIVSIAAGIPLADFAGWTSTQAVLFRLVPNTAISQLASMTLIASLNASREQEQLILDIFNELGLAMLVPEAQIAATTALTSCGIAYVLKYIQAGMQAGVEMGIYPKDAMKMVAQSVKGAAELILNNDTHPAVEIDKVTTPEGITIKGINELEHAGFTSAIIKAMKASN